MHENKKIIAKNLHINKKRINFKALDSFFTRFR